MNGSRVYATGVIRQMWFGLKTHKDGRKTTWIRHFSPDDVQSIVSGKLALRYSGPNVEAMKNIAQASQKRSLADFQKVKVVSVTPGLQ